MAYNFSGGGLFGSSRPVPTRTTSSAASNSRPTSTASSSSSGGGGVAGGNKVTSQQKVYNSSGAHVGTYNYNAAGNMVGRQWVVDGKWGDYGAVDPSTVTGHTTGATRSVASTSARNPAGGGGAGSTSRGSGSYNPFSSTNTSSYVRDDDPSSGIANPYGGGAANNFGNGPITQAQAQNLVNRQKENTYQTAYGDQVIWDGADQEAMFNYFGVNRDDGGTRAGGINTSGNYKPGDIIGRGETTADGAYMDRVFVGEGNGLFGSNYVPKLVRPKAAEVEEEEIEEFMPVETPGTGGGGGGGSTTPGTNVNVNSTAEVDNSTTGTIGNDNVIGDDFTFNNNNAQTNIDQGISVDMEYDPNTQNNFNIDREASIDNSVTTTIGDRNVIGNNAYIGNNDSISNIDQSFDLSIGNFDGAYNKGRNAARSRAENWLVTKSPLAEFNDRK